MKRRYEHLGHAPVYPPALRRRRPGTGGKSDWEIYKDIAKSFSQVCVGHLGKETDVVLVPLQHDSPANCRSRSRCLTGARANAI